MILYNITHLSARFNQKGNMKTMDKHVTFSPRAFAPVRSALIGQTEISGAEENMIAVDIIRRYADYFQKVISDYYKDKIQVVIQ